MTAERQRRKIYASAVSRNPHRHNGPLLKRINHMNNDSILSILEETAEMLTIKLDYEDLRKGVVNTDGGIFTLKGDRRILIHKGLGVKEKVLSFTEVVHCTIIL